MDIIERCSNYLSSGGLFNPEFADHDAVRDLVINCRDEIERLRGALKTIDSLIPKTKEITDFPYWVAIAGDIAEGALNGTWPAYGVMPASVKEKSDGHS